MRNVIIKSETDKVLSKNTILASFAVYISFAFAFLINLILANSLK